MLVGQLHAFTSKPKTNSKILELISAQSYLVDVSITDDSSGRDIPLIVDFRCTQFGQLLPSVPT